MRPLLLAALAASLAALSSCRNGEPPAPPGALWADAQHPFDATCSQCVEIGDGGIAHVGEARVYTDAVTDDPPAQWSRCVGSFLSCVRADGELPKCIADATCPQACKAEFTGKLGAATGFEAEVAAVDATFFDPGAPCALPDEPAVTP